MRIIFIGSTVDRETLNVLPDASVAGNKMQLGFIKGFIQNDVETIGVSVEPFAMWKFNKKPLFVKAKQLLDEQVKIHTVSYINIPFIKQISIYFSLKKQIKKEGVNKDTFLVVYNTMSIFALPVLNIAKKLGCKCVAVIADLPIKYKKNFLRRIEDKKQIEYIERFDGIIPLTEHIARDFAPDLPYRVVEAGCNVSDYIPEAEERRADNIKHIVFSGTLNQLSGISLIIEAMKYVEDNIVLDIYGKGIQEEYIIQKGNNNRNIIYHGAVANSEMIKIQSKADLLVCPRYPDDFTTKYTFPSKILEYICSGIPVLSNKLKGIPEEYEEYITLSSTDDPLAWANLIEEILIKNSKKYREKAIVAKKICLEKKSWREQTKKALELFNEIGEKNDSKERKRNKKIN